jgi:uncharacterized membrane protein YeaQ/YmgE (transglycosylase-associated protein family)
MGIVEALGWLVAGLIVGAVARLLIPGRQPIGCVLTAALGIVGALVGGALYNFIKFGSLAGDEGFNIRTAWPGWIFAILGGVIVMGLFVALTGRSRRRL